MITSRKFSLLALSISMAVLLLVGVANFYIDGDSSHHLPTDKSSIPRTTNHSALSKLHYIYEQHPDVMFFGSSRVEVGLPVQPELFAQMSVYNAGLSANTLGNTVPLIMHVLGGYTPKVIVLGVDYISFTAKPSPLSNLDMSLLSTNFSEYRVKRLLHDIKRSVTVDASQSSLTAFQALYNGRPYDPIVGVGSQRGQTSEPEMIRLTATRGHYVKAFQRTLQYAHRPPPAATEISAGLTLFEDFVAAACTRKIAVRVFSNPRHALAEYMLAKNGHWGDVERWKTALADISTRYQSGCDIKIFDFSGFNSVTTEPVGRMTAVAGLENYWEASHYRDNVGRMILHRIFSADPTLPADFGLELNNATVHVINSTVRSNMEQYESSRLKEIRLATEWLKVDTRN